MLGLSKNWTDLIKPTKVSIESLEQNFNATKFVIMPLERGFGVTLGNALRRILLSSLQGTAISAVSVSGVSHEFSSIPGVKEDMINVFLNLKSVVLRSTSNENKILHLNVKGPCVVTAGMIQSNNSIEVLNPDQVICTLSSAGSLEMELFCENGRGYLPTTAVETNPALPAGAIRLDALFSPVKQVSYHVEHTRIGQATDYDKLIMNIETNGSIAPELAIGVAAKILQDQLQLFVNFDDVEEDKIIKADTLPFNPALLRKVEELELSVRSQNCLKSDNILYIGDLVVRTESEMLKTPNFGRKSLNEIKELLHDMQLEFGMKVADWPPTNVEELAKKHEDVPYKFK